MLYQVYICASRPTAASSEIPVIVEVSTGTTICVLLSAINTTVLLQFRTPSDHFFTAVQFDPHRDENPKQSPLHATAGRMTAVLRACSSSTGIVAYKSAFVCLHIYTYIRVTRTTMKQQQCEVFKSENYTAFQF